MYNVATVTLAHFLKATHDMELSEPLKEIYIRLVDEALAEQERNPGYEDLPSTLSYEVKLLLLGIRTGSKTHRYSTSISEETK